MYSRLLKVAASASNVNLSEGLPMQISAEELKAVLLQPARTAADKATVLDARDRLVRIKKEGSNKSASDVKAVAVLTGTCPDMCPEKERYLRVEKRRLASYEILVNEGNVSLSNSPLIPKVSSICGNCILMNA